jgi:hypothetical protein
MKFSASLTIVIKEFEAKDEEQARQRLTYLRNMLVVGTPFEGTPFRLTQEEDNEEDN